MINKKKEAYRLEGLKIDHTTARANYIYDKNVHQFQRLFAQEIIPDSHAENGHIIRSCSARCQDFKKPRMDLGDSLSYGMRKETRDHHGILVIDINICFVCRSLKCTQVRTHTHTK